jgi:hypothetical protein
MLQLVPEMKGKGVKPMTELKKPKMCGCGYASKKDPELKNHFRPDGCNEHIEGHRYALERLAQKNKKEIDALTAALQSARDELKEMCTRVIEIAEKDELHILLQKVSAAERKARAILARIEGE